MRRVTSVTIDEEEVGSIGVRLLEEMVNGQRAIDSAEIIPISLDVHTGRTLGPGPALARISHRLS